MRNIIFKTKGFTIIEMMVTLSIITLLTVMVLAYSRQSESLTNLIRDSDRLLFKLRQVQSSSMLTLQKSDTSNSICGWGISFDSTVNNSYILFHDFCNPSINQGDNIYESGEEYETVNLLKGVVITKSDIASIVFVPPEPKIKISFDGASSQTLNTTVNIQMCLEANLPNCFTIHITPAGQIYKEQL